MINITNEQILTLTSEIINMCAEENVMLSCAESLTGGSLTSHMVDIPGAGAVLFDGIVAYHNDAKVLRLNVSQKTLSEFGAVSENVAAEMVLGLLSNDRITYAVSTTGIAGPTGDSAEKPIGLVYIAVGKRGKVQAHKFIFEGNREEIRVQSTYFGAKLLNEFIKGDIYGR